jgi:hypothetical protein
MYHKLSYDQDRVLVTHIIDWLRIKWWLAELSAGTLFPIVTMAMSKSLS